MNVADAIARVAEPVVAVGIGALPLWAGLVVTEARRLRGRLRRLEGVGRP